jgi:hypothetical protein
MSQNQFKQIVSCDEAAHVINDQDLYARDYPQCQATWPGPRVTHVTAEANINDVYGLGLTAASRLVFGMSIWVGIWVHAIA